MIRRNRRKPERALITAYDFEWKRETLQITLAGAYDERGYRWYQALPQFLTGELVPGNSGRRYYAHFGGAADMVFLLKELAKLGPSYRITGAFSGSSAIIVRVSRGELSWLFLDSFWTIRTRLADIGEWLGFPKLDCDTDAAGLGELRTYNERDCLILYKAMTAFQEVILGIGGEMGVTAASTGLKTFLRKYMGKPIRNGKALDAYARKGYVSARCEKNEDHCSNANYWDINSSFPYSMTFPLPGSRLLGSSGFECARGPFTSPGLPDPSVKTNLWFADCTIKSRAEFPTVPIRGEDGRVFFPNGTFRTVIASEDVLAGEFDIMKVHSRMSFEARYDWAAFAEEFYARRLASGFEGKVYKIVLNAGGYGKWAESEEKEILAVGNGCDFSDSTIPVAPGINISTVTKTIPHSHVPIAAMITARSRRFVLEYMRQARAGGGKVYYSDTDSVICDAHLAPCRPDGGDHSACSKTDCKRLGGLKREYVVKRGLFVASKLYALEKAGGGHEVKAKGFSRAIGLLSPLEFESLPKGYDERKEVIRLMLAEKRKARHDAGEGERVPLDYETFVKLSEQSAVIVERMARIKELVRREGSDYTPKSLVFAKRLNVGVKPKRRPTGGGGSVAWEWEELRQWERT